MILSFLICRHHQVIPDFPAMFYNFQCIGLLHLWSYFPQILHVLCYYSCHCSLNLNFWFLTGNIQKHNLFLYIDPLSWNVAKLSILVGFCRCHQIFRKDAHVICKRTHSSLLPFGLDATCTCLFSFPCICAWDWLGSPACLLNSSGRRWSHVPISGECQIHVTLCDLGCRFGRCPCQA